MGFSSKRVFFADPALIPVVAAEVVEQFRIEGYQVTKENLLSGGADISITKGGFFRAVLGMKMALKITIKQSNGHIQAEAGVGLYGQQVIPTMISLFVFWPVMLTQTWGMIQQSKLDNHAIELIDSALQRLQKESAAGGIRGSFCPQCGAKITGKFCASCGTKLS